MGNRNSTLILMAVALLALFLLAGCGKRVLRTADVSQGDYYTPEEFSRLSKTQRAEYCDQLAKELDVQQQNVEGTGQSVADANKKAAELESKLASMDANIAELQAKLSDLEAKKAERDRKPETYTVVDGDCLYKISGYDKIYADPLKWPRLYRANRDKIRDPNLIYPDWVLIVPRGFPKEWVVYAGEYLSKIAGYWEIYDNSSEWPKIYEANKDQISDPDLIYPDQVLKIPR